MRTADLLAVADREARTLAGEGRAASAAVMEEVADRLRTLAARLERMGESVEATPVVQFSEWEPDGVRIEA
jgi:hypothetical protein